MIFVIVKLPSCGKVIIAVGPFFIAKMTLSSGQMDEIFKPRSPHPCHNIRTSKERFQIQDQYPMSTMLPWLHLTISCLDLGTVVVISLNSYP